MDVILHLGAHKTGTTFIQSALSANITALAALNVAYIPLRELREAVTSALPVEASFAAESRARRKIRKAGASASTLILSDENILGSWRRPPNRRLGLYPRAVDRLRRMRDFGLLASLSIKFGIRRYDEYLPSMYCEALRHGPFVTFDEFMSQYDPAMLSWVNVVRDIRHVFPNAPLHVWDFEVFKSDPISVVNHVAGLPRGAIRYAAEPVRESLSDTAIRKLTELRGHVSDEGIRARVREFESAYPRSAGHPPFRPFAEAEAKRLHDLHRSHLQALRSMGGVMVEQAELESSAFRPVSFLGRI